MSEREPIHEPALPYIDEEVEAIHAAADRFEHATAPELLEWALDRFHPRMAISAAGGVDGMALIDMAWRINPEIRVFTLDTGRLPPETYTCSKRSASTTASRWSSSTRTARPSRSWSRPKARTLCTAAFDLPRGVLRDPQGRAAEAQARHARRVGRRPSPRAVEDAQEHREGRGRPRPRRHREAESDGRLGRPGLGLRPQERGPLPRAVRPRVHVDRLRAVYASVRPASPSAPAVGGGRRRPTRSAVCTARLACWTEVRQRARGESASDYRGGVVAMPFGYPVFLELPGDTPSCSARPRSARARSRGCLRPTSVGEGIAVRSAARRGVARRAGRSRDGRASRVAARRSRRTFVASPRPTTLPSALRSRARRATAGSS